MLKTSNKKLIASVFGNFFYLLVALIVYLLSTPFITSFGFGKILVLIFFSTIFFASIYALEKNKRSLVMAIGLTLLAVGTRITAYLHSGSFINLTSDIVNIICFAIIAVVILIHVLKDREISLNEIYGAICAYLLLGLAWAFLYSAIDSINSAAFYFPMDGLDPLAKVPRFIYFSFITLTSTGYGDIYPLSLFAEAASYLEAIVGQIYFVVLIGWMVGIYVSRSHKK